MKATERLWRTREGQRLVLDGDLDAAVLVYAAGDEIAKADEDNMPSAPDPEPNPEPEPDPEPEPEPQAKAKQAPANKARRKPADK